MALSVGHPRGTHSRYVIGCCLIPLGICGLKNNSRRITYGKGCVWGMPFLSPLSSLVWKRILVQNLGRPGWKRDLKRPPRPTAHKLVLISSNREPLLYKYGLYLLGINFVNEAKVEKWNNVSLLIGYVLASTPKINTPNYFKVFCHVSLKNHISGVIYSSISSYTSLEREKNTLSKKKIFRS